jgi:UDP-N-acetylglucosamine--N-acetylmuramyl-(pentapeptide) pyrophosphoryl-undecaprenol N-acetylglucosamine transferase
LRLLICAGGTGGGVYPALAVLQALKNDDRSNETDFRLLWIGGIGGMEVNLVKQAGVPFEAIPAAGVHGVGWRALPGNAMQLGRGYLAARRLLRRFRPEVLFFTGGYLAVPVALAARLPGRGYPRPRSLLYIPDIEPGLALKSLARLADRITVTTDATQPFLPSHPPVVVTGYPTRPELRSWDKDRARQVLALDSEAPVLLVFGGSKGARSINHAVWAVLPELLAEMQVVHLTGQLDWPEVEPVRQRLEAAIPRELYTRYHPYPFLHQEMGAAFTVADLALCRAGASTLGELPHFALPAVLVPYPYAWRYQQVNAHYMAERGAAIILQDAELPARTLALIRELMDDGHKRAQMRQAMASLAQPAAAEKIAWHLYSLASSLGGVP